MAFDRGSFIERLPADGYPTTGGTPATITVNLDHDQLLDRLAPATASTGPRLSGGQARRLACERGSDAPAATPGPAITDGDRDCRCRLGWAETI